ncbi:MAG: lysylphosphatidylglycerol synthase transmembrane domain-containing protein [Candidatus Micrarchaeota archaeon]
MFDLDRLNIALAVVSLALLVGMLAFVDVGKVAATLSHADPLLALAALLVGFVGLSLRTVRWGVLVREKAAVPWRDLYVIQCSGMAVSHFSPGKVLEVVKAVPLKRFGLSYSFVLLSIVWERVMDLLVIFAFTFLALPAFDEALRLVLLAVFALVVLVAIASFRHLERLITLLARLPFLGFLARVQAHNFRKRTLAAAFLLTLVSWLADAVAALLAFKSLGVDVEFLRLASAYMASIIVGILSFLPGGLGSTEAVMVFLLKGGGYPLAVILGGVLLARAFTLGVSVVVGFALLPLVRK